MTEYKVTENGMKARLAGLIIVIYNYATISRVIVVYRVHVSENDNNNTEHIK